MTDRGEGDRSDCAPIREMPAESALLMFDEIASAPVRLLL
jgi:hypothetical protein